MRTAYPGPHYGAASDNASERKLLKSLRCFCLQCQGEQTLFVRTCPDTACALYPFRLPGACGVSTSGERAVRAVRRYCLMCAGTKQDVRGCAAGASCPLWVYRFGVHPATRQRVTARRTTPQFLRLPGFPSGA
jgi:hypothetical protein